ncbi:ABC transporter permease [Enterococcus faecalis]|nr:ABC transporter permease [Enterococcus faecalis]
MILQRIINILGTFIFPLLMYIFVFNSNLSEDFLIDTKTTDYLTYLTLGQAFMIIIIATLMNVGRSMITEYRQNTIVNLLYSPASILSYLIGVFLEQFIRTIVESFVILGIGIVLGANVSLTHFFVLIFFFCCSSFASFSIAIITCGIMLKTRDTFITQNTIILIISIVCGITIPTSFLPDFVQCISSLLPLTHLLIAFRNCVILNQFLYENFNSILLSVVLSGIYTVVGFFFLKRVVRSVLEIV